jgi:hypothetical protein
MAARFLRSLVCVVTIASVLTGCAHYSPEPVAVNSREVVDIREEHPRLNSISDICYDRDMLCILAGIAIFGGAVAAFKASE